VNYNLYGVGGSFNLKAENRKTKVDNVFLGVSSPKLNHGLFPKWTRLQRFLFRLPKQFLHGVGFKLRGLFLRLLKFFYRLLRLFPRLLSSFNKLPRLLPRMLKFFSRLLRLFRSLHVLFSRNHRVLRLYPRLCRLFHKLHRSFSMLVA
jgi:hypothetical protein